MPYGFWESDEGVELVAYDCEYCGHTSIADWGADPMPGVAYCIYCTRCGKQQSKRVKPKANGNGYFTPRLRPRTTPPPSSTADFDEIRTFFERTHGLPVRLWSYGVSHCELQLRIRHAEENRNTLIHCSGVDEITVPTNQWNSAMSFALEKADERQFLILRDQGAGVRIVCRMIRLYFDVEPGL